MNTNLETKYGIVSVYYQYNHLSKISLVFLHGWKMNKETFNEVYLLYSDYTVVGIDFLGFGSSSEPYKPLTVNNYCEVVNEVLNKLNINNKVVLIGHSFGARVSLVYSLLYKVHKIFLVNFKAFKTKGIKHILKIYKYKLKKLLYRVTSSKKYHQLIESSGSVDYIGLSKVMKMTMSKVVNDDLLTSLKKCTARTILLASVNDSVVSYNESLKIYQALPNAILYPFYNSNHFIYLTEKHKFNNILLGELND